MVKFMFRTNTLRWDLFLNQVKRVGFALLRMKYFLCLFFFFSFSFSHSDFSVLVLPAPRAVLVNSGLGGADIYLFINAFFLMVRCSLCSWTHEADGLTAASVPCAGELDTRAFSSSVECVNEGKCTGSSV